MVIDKIIQILSEYLDVDEAEITENTMIFMEYDLEDEDVMEIINLLNEEFDIEIDFDELCELSKVEEFAEYIESLC